jgi:hypothetical protein
MKRLLACFVFVALVAASGAASASAQSLGEVAREHRAKKPAPSPGSKVYTNDTVSSDTPAVASAEPQPAETSSDSDSASSEASTSKGGSGSSAEERAKAETEWKAKFAEQKKVISGLEKEIDILKRENKLRAATYYSDAGNRLRDEKKYAEDDRKYQADIATKEQELATARQRFEDMQEEARKAGMSSRVSED